MTFNDKTFFASFATAALRRPFHLVILYIVPMESDSKPVIILIHGAWHSPDAWNRVKTRLEAAGFEVYTPRLLTVVGPEPSNHSWRADVAVVHDIVVPLFRQGREAVIVGHSYGGIVATVSVEGQSVAERKSRGLRGGFSAIVFICAIAIAQRGHSLLTILDGKYPEWMVAAEPSKNVSPASVSWVFFLAVFNLAHVDTLLDSNCARA